MSASIHVEHASGQRPVTAMTEFSMQPKTNTAAAIAMTTGLTPAVWIMWDLVIPFATDVPRNLSQTATTVFSELPKIITMYVTATLTGVGPIALSTVVSVMINASTVMVLAAVTAIRALKMQVSIIMGTVYVIQDGMGSIVLIITVHVMDIVHHRANINIRALVAHRMTVSNVQQTLCENQMVSAFAVSHGVVMTAKTSWDNVMPGVMAVMAPLT